MSCYKVNQRTKETKHCGDKESFPLSPGNLCASWLFSKMEVNLLNWHKGLVFKHTHTKKKHKKGLYERTDVLKSNKY